MNETRAQSSEPPEEPGGKPPVSHPEPTEPRRGRLRRSGTDRIIGGVAGGLGEYFRVDPIIFRIGFAVFTFVGGIGALAYLAALLFVPSEDAALEGSGADREWWTPLRVGGVMAIAVASLWALAGGVWWLDGAAWGLLTVAVLAALVAGGYLLLREREGAGVIRALALVVLAVVVAGLGIALALLSALATAAGWGVVVGIAALLIAGSLAVLAFRGPAAGRWLIVPGLLIVVPMAIVLAAGIEIEGGIGTETHTPVSSAALPEEGYRMAIGELRVDLRNLDWRAQREVELEVEMGVGAIEVAVPPDVCVESRLGSRIGAVGVRDGESGGIDVEYTDDPPGTRAPRLVLDGSVGIGAIWVANDLHREGHRRSWFGDRGGGPTNAEACAER